jgi:ribosomal protein S18 acetylase RimI-like enzyme
VEFRVHPDYRDDAITGHLTGWFLRTGKLVHARTFPDAPLELHASAGESQRWCAGMLEAAGYRHVRTFVEMRADLAASPPAPPLPVELPLERFQEKYDEATRQACNATFAHHWGSTVQSPAVWRHRLSRNTDFRPDLSFLLLSPARDQVVAFVLSSFFVSEAAATGVRELYVNYVGTRAELRGRGVATALLAHTLAEAKAQGFERSSLEVDLDNADRAVGIYEHCGYRVSRRRARYVLPVTCCCPLSPAGR